MKRIITVITRVIIIAALTAFFSCEESSGTEKKISGQVEIPQANQADNYIFPVEGWVFLSCDTKGADIFYTTNDGAPEKKYITPINITRDTAIKAIARKTGMRDSDELSVSYKVITNEAMSFAAEMKIGWNLGNTFDGHSRLMPSETSWQSARATQELMDKAAAYGFGAARIPVTWGQKLGGYENLRRNPGQITLSIEEIEALELDAAWLDRVAEVVEYANNAGMKAIINIHHDGADSSHWLSVKTADLTGENKAKVDAIFKTLWKQIAEKFKNTGDYLIFEGFNELHDGSWSDGNDAQHKRIDELNQLFVNTVRSSGGKNADRFLLIHGWVTRPSVTVRKLVMPSDSAVDRLIVGFHYYDPYDFSGSGNWETWGSKSLTGSNGWANENYVRNTFNSVKSRFIDNGIPVIIGEYGAVNQITDKGKEHRKYYMEYVTKYARDCGFIPFYWDNAGFGININQTTGAQSTGEKFGLFYRTPPFALPEESVPILEVMMKAVNEAYQITGVAAP